MWLQDEMDGLRTRDVEGDINIRDTSVNGARLFSLLLSGQEQILEVVADLDLEIEQLITEAERNIKKMKKEPRTHYSISEPFEDSSDSDYGHPEFDVINATVQLAQGNNLFQRALRQLHETAQGIINIREATNTQEREVQQHSFDLVYLNPGTVIEEESFSDENVSCATESSTTSQQTSESDDDISFGIHVEADNTLWDVISQQSLDLPQLYVDIVQPTLDMLPSPPDILQQPLHMPQQPLHMPQQPQHIPQQLTGNVLQISLDVGRVIDTTLNMLQLTRSILYRRLLSLSVQNRPHRDSDISNVSHDIQSRSLLLINSQGLPLLTLPARSLHVQLDRFLFIQLPNTISTHHISTTVRNRPGQSGLIDSSALSQLATGVFTVHQVSDLVSSDLIAEILPAAEEIARRVRRCSGQMSEALLAVSNLLRRLGSLANPDLQQQQRRGNTWHETQHDSPQLESANRSIRQLQTALEKVRSIKRRIHNICQSAIQVRVEMLEIRQIVNACIERQLEQGTSQIAGNVLISAVPTPSEQITTNLPPQLPVFPTLRMIDDLVQAMRDRVYFTPPTEASISQDRVVSYTPGTVHFIPSTSDLPIYEQWLNIDYIHNGFMEQMFPQELVTALALDQPEATGSHFKILVRLQVTYPMLNAQSLLLPNHTLNGLLSSLTPLQLEAHCKIDLSYFLYRKTLL